MYNASSQDLNHRPKLKFSVTDTCIRPQALREGKQQKLGLFCSKKDKWIHIFVKLYMKLRQMFFFLWLCTHAFLYDY